MRKVFFAFALVAVFVATPAYAQQGVGARSVGTQGVGPQGGDYELQLGAGGTSGNDFDQSTFSTDVTLGYYLNDRWMASFRQNADYTGDGGSAWNGSTRVGLVYHFNLGEVRPFLGADLGYVYGDSVDDTYVADGSGGLKWYVKPETFIFVRADYQFFFEESNQANNAVDDGQWLYTAGLGLNF